LEKRNEVSHRKLDGKHDAHGKNSQRNKNPSNIKIPTSVMKTLGLGLNNRNIKSNLQYLMGETHKNKGK